MNQVHLDKTRLLENFYPEPWSSPDGQWFFRRYSLHYSGVVKVSEPGKWQWGIGDSTGQPTPEKFVMGKIASENSMMKAFDQCDQAAHDVFLL